MARAHARSLGTPRSAQCTHPDARGRGLGPLLTRTVVAGIRTRGEEAFLHVAEFNTDAIRLYEALGFVLRSIAEVADLRPTGVRGDGAGAAPGTSKNRSSG